MSFMEASDTMITKQCRTARFRERMTKGAVLYIHETPTSEDRQAVEIVKQELGDNVPTKKSDTDPYDVRPRLEAGRGSVYRGVGAINALFVTIRSLA
ncbi:MAG: hypothetical protein Q8M19_14165 [Reyranella sp.]|nr:hypothetical protein [Reyranella sp.]